MFHVIIEITPTTFQCVFLKAGSIKLFFTLTATSKLLKLYMEKKNVSATADQGNPIETDRNVNKMGRNVCGSGWHIRGLKVAGEAIICYALLR